MNQSELQRSVAQVKSTTDVAACEATIADVRTRHAPSASTYDTFMKVLGWAWVALALVTALVFIAMGAYAWFFVIFIIFGAVILGVLHILVSVLRAQHRNAYDKAVAAMNDHVRGLGRPVPE
ncbi:hypothetical protein [Demequina aurantiaca]|uniref:hypothetical protein n=1 Tax=Demequina aurantiaca TaxID=676200 RepID=UPI003D3568C5